ncbi:hypothetical protein CDIK_1388 [Cucumispora dikerogammari]|nr:hypothetical protein CDIK_1388 [Cucumispora dikerogammari]
MRETKNLILTLCFFTIGTELITETSMVACAQHEETDVSKSSLSIDLQKNDNTNVNPSLETPNNIKQSSDFKKAVEECKRSFIKVGTGVKRGGCIGPYGNSNVFDEKFLEQFFKASIEHGCNSNTPLECNVQSDRESAY